MAALTATSIVTDGKDVGEYAGPPVLVTLDLAGTSDTFAWGSPIRKWAFISDIADLHRVTKSGSTFTITSDTGAGSTITLLVWPATK